MDSAIFREYDIRGIADKDLNKEVMEKVGKAFGTKIINAGRKDVILCRDNRLSSEKFRNAMKKALMSTGCNVIDIGELPTTAFYFALVHYKVPDGVQITASHNPVEFNGIKTVFDGNALFGEDLQHLREAAESGDFSEGEGSEEDKNPLFDYVNAIKDRTKTEKKLKIIIDAGNGTTNGIGPRIFKELGMDVDELYTESDGSFPNHLADPTQPDLMKDLIKKMKTGKYDVGIAYDADGDRVGAVDDKGRLIWGDQLLMLYAKEILEKGKTTVVFEVKCSQALVEVVEAHGGTPIIWKTGYPHIKKKMRETGAKLGGEMSGHMYFSDDYFGFDDGLYASARLVQLLSRTDKKFSELIDDLPKYFSTPEVRVECPDDKKFQLVEEVKEFFAKDHDIIDVDGVRVLFGDGWALVRASNTQPALVVRVEAKTKKRLEELKKIVDDKLKEYPFIKVKWG